ncbi:MAG TPA: Rid family detoxifying hydrolase [Thermoanaerobaculia bacterium]|nr:Rid family detoxifying hydrolase [Thermoanaerobaculia bacterium]
MVRRLAFLACAAWVVSAGCASTRILEEPGTPRRVIATDRAPAAIAAYSQGIEVGNTLYLAGQLGMDPKTRELVPGGIGAETRQAITNCQAILEAAGYTLADVAQVQVLLADINDYAALNEVYVTFFPKDPPARAAYAVAALPRGARVEILMTAAK